MGISRQVAANIVGMSAFLLAGLQGRLSMGWQDSTAPADTSTAGAVQAAAVLTSESSAPEPILLDLNRATASELRRIPQLGMSTIQRIIAGRPYQSVDDLARSGVHPRTIETLRPIVYVGPPTAPPPREQDELHDARTRGRTRTRTNLVDLNTADAATLQTLPGIGPTLAAAIIKARPIQTPADVLKIPGMNPGRLEAIRGYATLRSVNASNPNGQLPLAGLPLSQNGSEPTTLAINEHSSTNTPPSGKRLVNLNSASLAELEQLPSIGPARAQAIIQYRPYRTIEEVMKVPGIKKAIFEKIREQISVE